MKKMSLVTIALLLAVSGNAFAEKEQTRKFSCIFKHFQAGKGTRYFGHSIEINESEFNYTNEVQTFWKDMKGMYLSFDKVWREIEITAAMDRLGSSSELRYITVNVMNLPIQFLEIQTQEIKAFENQVELNNSKLSDGKSVLSIKCNLRKEI